MSEVGIRFPRHTIRTIFDIGAWQGVTAMEFSDAFPEATVYAFEPVRSNYNEMARVLVGKPEVRRFNLAIGAVRDKGHVEVRPVHTTLGRLLNEPSEITHPVEIETLDNFCADHGISDIDILKIDVEGHELQVLQGSSKLLQVAKIGLIKLECTVDPEDDWHTQFFSLCEVLLPCGYRLFGFYDQCEAWETPQPNLERFDAAFVSKPFFSLPR